MNLTCPYCHSQNTLSDSRKSIVCSGRFFRRCDQSFQQRFFCRLCKRSFSEARYQLCYRQRKRQINKDIFNLLVSGISQRRLAYILRVNRKTIVRKFHFLGILAHHVLQEQRSRFPVSLEIEFDDLETMEHSKLKPLSVIMAVESHTRRILGFRVARMPAKGLLVKRALKKYGPRPDERGLARKRLFEEISPHVCPHALIKSDESPHYPRDVKKYFPGSTHKVFKGRRGCVVGQGELKGGGFDPLFSLNHSFAMKRANINRLFRRTWNTTKKPSCLALHISLYVLFHNLQVIKPKVRCV